MKSIFAVILLSSFAALAGQGTCNEAQTLVCTSYNILGGGSPQAGVTQSSAVQDLQPEPFDPAECQASVVVEDMGIKFVADYDQNLGQLSAWYDNAGKESVLLSGSQVQVGVPTKTDAIIVTLNPGVRSIYYVCTIVQK